MNAEKKIWLAFVMNLLFSIFEFAGGIFTGSVAILSDALHDLGDAAGIGVSYALEKKSNRQPDEIYTYGYGRFSVLGGAITSLILLLGSVLVICGAVDKLFHPSKIHYEGMIVFAVVGVCVNFCAAVFTRGGRSLNQKAVSLHMLEDVLGWAVVLVGAVVMRLTDFVFLDPLMSMGVAAFILAHAVRNLAEALEVFLEKAPHGVSVQEIREHISGVKGVAGVHHIHVWSIDGQHNCATVHIVTDADPQRIRAAVREELREHGIEHATLELERKEDTCSAVCCRVEEQAHSHHHHHHHH